MRGCFFSIFVFGFGAALGSVSAQTLPSASPVDLPLPPWGFASRLSDAPTFLADRTRDRLFSFPIVVGQKRTEAAFPPYQKGGGRPERVAILRRGLGLSSAEGSKDDRGGEMARRWRVTESDAKNLLTRFVLQFPPVLPSQRILTGDGPALPWTSGQAELTLYAGNAAPSAEGLIVEVKFTNDSEEAETYFVDVLTSMESDLPLSPDPHLVASAEGSTLTAEHAEAKLAFAVSGGDTPFSRRGYRVSSLYFEAKSNLEKLIPGGGSVPGGALTPLDTAPGWGLLRTDNIAVPARASVTVRLCIGAGTTAAFAQSSAQTLLGVVSDRLPDGSKRDTPGLGSLALTAHREAQRTIGSPALDALLTRSFVTLPLEDNGRAGTFARLAPPTLDSCLILTIGWGEASPEMAVSEAAVGLTLLSRLAPEKRPQALLALLTALEELPPDIRRLSALKRHFPEFSGAAKGLGSALPFLAAALLERFALETGAAKEEADFWLAAREKGSTAFFAEREKPMPAPSGTSVSAVEFWLRWHEGLDRGEIEPLLKGAGQKLADLDEAEKRGRTPPDALMLLPLYRLLHTPGTVAHGRLISLIISDYSLQKDTLRLGLRLTETKGTGVILCRLGKPNTFYKFSPASLPERKTDENGILLFPAPLEKGTQVLDITPVQN